MGRGSVNVLRCQQGALFHRGLLVLNQKCGMKIKNSFFFICAAFGLRGAHGHIDFYANGGVDQPGCPKTIFAGP